MSDEVQENKEQEQEQEQKVDNVDAENDQDANRSQDRYKLDMIRYKKELQKLQEEREQEKKKRLLEKENYKEAYERTNKELEELKTQTVTSAKSEAIEKEALKQGIDPDFLDFLHSYDLSELEVENENGRTRVPGAKEFIESLKASKPKMFNVKKDPGINNGGGQNSFVSGSVITYQELMKFSKNDPAKYQKLHNEIKSGKIKLKL